MKAILFDLYFDAPDELNEFCKSIGYKYPIYYRNFDIMFDNRVVEFCEQRLSKLWNEYVYKGKENHKFRCGFAGAGYIRDIDITRRWRIKHNNIDMPIVYYVDVKTNKYGYTDFVEDK